MTEPTQTTASHTSADETTQVPALKKPRPAPAAVAVAGAATPAAEPGLFPLHYADLTVLPNVRTGKLNRGKLEELAHSIRDVGQLEPVKVRKSPPGAVTPYELVFGQRRRAAVELNALKHGGDGMLRCEITTASDEDIPFLQLIENLQREDMTDGDKATALANLKAQRGLTLKALGERVSLSERQVRTYVLIGEAPPFIRAYGGVVEVQVKVKDANGKPATREDGTPKAEDRELPGLSLDKLLLLIKLYDELAQKDERFADAPGYKPQAEKAVRSMAQRAAVHEWTKAQLQTQVQQRLVGGRGADEKNDAGPPPASSVFRINAETIRIDLKHIDKLSVAERRAMAAQLHAALVKLGPDYFTAVELRGP